jgi:hypothetical protein
MNQRVLLPLFLLTSGGYVAGMGTGPTLQKSSPGELIEILGRLAEGLRHGSVLDKRREAAMNQLHTREAMLTDLLGRRMTLPEAAARFREWDRELASRRLTTDLGAARSEGERCGRLVIEWVRSREGTPSDPGAFALRRRLEAELEELLQRDGEIRLPEWSRETHSQDSATWP